MSESILPIQALLGDVQQEIWDGDLVILRNGYGKAINAAKACRWDGELFCVEVRKYLGVVAVPLEQLACRYPGRVEIYEVNPQSRWENYDRQGPLRHLKSVLFSGKDRRTAFLETLLENLSKLIGRNIVKQVSPCHGAEAIRLADRLGGGVDPVPEKTSERIEIADLEQSPLYRYRFTLK